MDEVHSAGIQLDPYDDVVTAQQKILAAAGNLVTVTIPGTSPLKNRTSLRLLMQGAAAEGKTVTFTSTDPAIIALIHSLEDSEQAVSDAGPSSAFVVGRDVAEDLSSPAASASQQGTVRSRALSVMQAGPAWIREMIKTRAALSVGGALLTAVAIVGILYFLYTAAHRATIRVVVTPESIVKSFEVAASPTTESVDTANKKIPAVLYEYTEVGTEVTKTSTNQVVGEKAAGFVTIYNKTDENREFPKGNQSNGGENGRRRSCILPG